jgi:hypothetical protein
VAALFGPLTADVQAELAGQARAAIDKAVRQVLVERAVVEPLTGSTQGASSQQLTIVADKGDVNGRARFSVPFGPNIDGQITLTAPLTGGGASFVSLGGFSPNASVNASLKWTVWNRKDAVRGDSLAALASTMAPMTGADSGSATQQALAGLEIARRIAGTFRSTSTFASTAAAARGPSALARVLASPMLVATPERFYAAVVQQMPKLTSTEWAGYITVGADSNRHAVDYLTADTFETRTFERTVPRVAMSGGVSKMGQFQVESADPLKRPLFFAGTAFGAGSSVLQSDPQKICRPIGTAGATECVESPVGKPTIASTVSWTGELRFWSWGALQSIGFNPRYTYTRQRSDIGDTRTVRTIESPIYFMHQVKDVTAPDVTFGADLIGGASVGWRQSTIGGKTKEGVFVSLFLTKAFGLP